MWGKNSKTSVCRKAACACTSLKQGWDTGIYVCSVGVSSSSRATTSVTTSTQAARSDRTFSVLGTEILFYFPVSCQQIKMPRHSISPQGWKHLMLCVGLCSILYKLLMKQQESWREVYDAHCGWRYVRRYEADVLKIEDDNKTMHSYKIWDGIIREWSWGWREVKGTLRPMRKKEIRKTFVWWYEPRNAQKKSLMNYLSDKVRNTEDAPIGVLLNGILTSKGKYMSFPDLRSWWLPGRYFETFEQSEVIWMFYARKILSPLE